MRALDFGCAMGFFTLPLAELVGPTGRVYAVDVQDGMLDQLKRRAARRGLSGRIFIRRCGHEDFGLQEFEGAMDFILAFAVIHEVPDVQRLLAAFHRALKPGGTLLIAEPKGHVDGPAFEAEVRIAKETGFILRTTPRVGCAYAALLAKQ